MASMGVINTALGDIDFKAAHIRLALQNSPLTFHCAWNVTVITTPINERIVPAIKGKARLWIKVPAVISNTPQMVPTIIDFCQVVDNILF